MQLPRDDNGRLESWAWPGGYPIFYMDGDGSVLCPNCARTSDEDPSEDPGFKPIHYAIHYGINYIDTNLYCENCGATIDPAYQDVDLKFQVETVEEG